MKQEMLDKCSSHHCEVVIVSTNNRFCSYIMLSSMLVLVAVLIYALSWTSIHGDLGKTTNKIGIRSAPTLKFLIIVSRHGNRMSLFTFPNDPYPLNDTIHWNYGLGELTTFGRVQMYKLGVKIRSIYNGFLKPQYYNEDFYASSTPTDRTMISAGSFLAGLYPPKGFQLWDNKILWQPIPVYSDSLDKTMVRADCSRFVEDLAISKANYEKENAENLTTVVNYLNLYAGVNLSGSKGFLTVWDTLISEDSEKFALPDWTKKAYPEPMAALARKLCIAYVAGTDTMTRLLIGPFFQNMIEIMERKINGTLVPERQMYFYSGHDVSLINLQVVLGISNSLIPLVLPGSAMIYELHQDPNTEKFSVQDGSPPHYPLPVRQFLDEHFEGRWISMRAAVEWQARSPNFNSLDFFLWDHLKTVVYKTPVEDMNQLQGRIINKCSKITPEMFHSVRQSLIQQLYHCQAVEGNQFEHLN